jgi:DNA polymerase I
VFYSTRFLIDNGIYTHIEVDKDETWDSQYISGDYRVHVDDIEAVDTDWKADPRQITVDIEVESPDGFPDPDEADQPVTAITAHDNYTDEYTVWVLRYEGWAYSDTEIQNMAVENRPSNVNISDVRVFDEESALLHNFNQYVEEKRPDMLGGWNSSTTDNGEPFDYPYLINRCQSFNIMSYKDWSPMGQIWDGGWGPDGKGIVFFDMMKAYKKTQFSKPNGGYGLDNIANRELGFGKEDMDDIDSAWRDEVELFLKYNMRDVQAVIEIDESAGVTDLFQNIRKLTGVQFDNCHNNIDILDPFILREAYNAGIALPTNEEPERDWYYGAHNFTPEFGRHKNAVYPDLWSMYPNMIRNCNMSPETLIGTEEDLEASEYTKDDCRWTYIDTRKKNIKKEDSPNYEKLYFCKPSIKEGFMNSVVDELMGMKNDYDGTDLYGAVKRVVNSCFTPDTEVLTPNGVRNITDIEVGDDVYSYNPKTKEMQVKPVTETIEKPNYDGEIVHIQNQSMDLKVTPDHRFLANKPRHGGGYEYTEAGNLNKWTQYETPNNWSSTDGSGIDTIDLADYYDGDTTDESIRCSDNGRHNTIPRHYDADNVITLLGWFITEGSVYLSGDEPRGDRISISQYKSVHPDHHSEIVELFEEMGLSYTVTDTDINHSGSVWAEMLTEWCGEGSHNMTIPSWVFEKCSTEQKKLLRDTMMKGDGDTADTPKRYTTVSTNLRDDFMRLVWETGHPVTYTEDDSSRHGDSVWRVFWRTERSNMSFRCHRDETRERAQNGVYCIQVEDNHMLVAGRNGKFTNIPNCYGVFGDSNSYGKGYRLYDWRIAEGITLGGRKMIIDSSDTFVGALNDIKEERGYDGQNARLVGGDTDSVMSAVPYVDIEDRDDMEEVVEIAHDAADRVNEWYNEWTEDTFNIKNGEHYCRLEIESYAPWLFVPEPATKNAEGKKRYAEIIAWEEGEWFSPPEFHVTGIDVVRSDRATITREVCSDVLEHILRIDDRSEAREAIRERIKTAYDAAQRGECSNAYIARPKGMSMHPDEYGSPTELPSTTYRGAKYANKNFDWEHMGEGSKPQLLHIERVRGDWPSTYTAKTKEDGMNVDAVSVENPNKVPDNFVIDMDTQLQKTIGSSLTPILSAMNWSYKSMISDTKQTDIEKFM